MDLVVNLRQKYEDIQLRFNNEIDMAVLAGLFNILLDAAPDLKITLSYVTALDPEKGEE